MKGMADVSLPFMMMEVRKAESKDVDQIVEIMNQAKTYFKENGIPQWQGEYPNEIDVMEDIRNSGAYVVSEEDEVLGYSYIASINDPNYAWIEGKWLNSNPYYVVHRTCVRNTCKGQGIASMLISFAKEKALAEGLRNIRIDTHEMNHSMRRLIEKSGFAYCGIIHVEDGSPRYAYQLLI